MDALRRELRRSVRPLRVWVAALVLVLVSSLWVARSPESHGLYWTAVGVAGQIPLWFVRWWPVERALHRTRHLAEAVPVEVVTPRWDDRTTVRTPQGSEWRWTVQPIRVFSARTPIAGDAAWVAQAPEGDPRPTILVIDGPSQEPRPQVGVSLRRAVPVTPASV